MKKIISKFIYGYIHLLIGLFSFSPVTAQCGLSPCPTCPEGYIWGAHYEQDCTVKFKCVKPGSGWINEPSRKCGGAHIDARNKESTPVGESSLSEKLLNGIYPNPIVSSATIYIVLFKSQKVALRIFDMNGRLVKSLAEKQFTEGEHKITWNAANAKSGIYLLRLETTGYSETQKIIVTK
jgi:hypothetical protein